MYWGNIQVQGWGRGFEIVGARLKNGGVPTYAFDISKVVSNLKAIPSFIMLTHCQLIWTLQSKGINKQSVKEDSGSGFGRSHSNIRVRLREI